MRTLRFTLVVALFTSVPSEVDAAGDDRKKTMPAAEFGYADKIEAQQADAFACRRPLFEDAPCLRFSLAVYRSQPAGKPLGISLPYKIDHRLFTRLRRDFGDKATLAASAMRRALKRAPSAPTLPAEKKRRMLRWLDGAPHYQVRDGVNLSPGIERRLAILAAAFYRKRRRRLLITSATRGSLAQAKAMYIKLILRANLRRLYRQRKAVGEVIRAYRRGHGKKLGHKEIIKAMAAVIDDQIKQDIYLSPHLRAGAVDVRSRGMRRRDRRIFHRLAQSYKWIRFVKLERRPPHFHVEIEPEP